MASCSWCSRSTLRIRHRLDPSDKLVGTDEIDHEVLDAALAGQEIGGDTLGGAAETALEAPRHGVLQPILNEAIVGGGALAQPLAELDGSVERPVDVGVAIDLARRVDGLAIV